MSGEAAPPATRIGPGVGRRRRPDRPGGRGGTVRMLALVPSRGLGGGIERYIGGVLRSVAGEGVEVRELALTTAGAPAPTVLAKLRFALRAGWSALALRRAQEARILSFHPGFLTVLPFLRRLAGLGGSRTVAFFYGQDAVDLGAGQRRVVRSGDVALVAISEYTAGALAAIGPASVLAPGIEEAWYRRLADLPGRDRRDGALWVLSVFRLEAAEDKGASVLLRAADAVRSGGRDVRVRFAGTGSLPEALQREVEARRPWAEVVESPSDGELARCYGQADLVVLATRTAAGPAGFIVEGFGMVLAEAQLAGLPVIGPARGSLSAYIPGVTGFTPPDESAESLEEHLAWAADNGEELAAMGARARAIASERYRPSRYKREVQSLLIGRLGTPGQSRPSFYHVTGDRPSRGAPA